MKVIEYAYLFAVLLVTGCNQQPSNTRTTDTEKTAAIPQIEKSTQGPFVMKGLSVGMTIDDARAVLLKELQGFAPNPYQAAGITEIVKTADGFRFEVEASLTTYVSVSSDSNRKVIDFHFGSAAVNKLFGAEKMEGEEFAQNFVNAYSIKELKPLDDGSGWYNIVSDGIRITITSAKELRIQKDLSNDEKLQKFN